MQREYAQSMLTCMQYNNWLLPSEGLKVWSYNIDSKGQPTLAHTNVAPSPYHQMVKDIDIQEFASINNLACNMYIFW